jgi:hypothetical protein
MLVQTIPQNEDNSSEGHILVSSADPIPIED